MSTTRRKSYQAENAELRTRLADAEETLRAIRAGEVDGLVVQGQNGTQLYTLHSAEAASNQFRGEILAQVEDAVVAVDLEERLTFINAAAERLYGVEHAEILGRKLSDLRQNHWHRPEDEAAARESIKSRASWTGETLQIRRDGSKIHVETSVSCLIDSAGQTIGLLAIIRDITKRKSRETTLSFLGKVQQELMGSMSPEGLAEAIGLLIVKHLGLSRCVFCIIGPLEDVSVFYDHHRPGLKSLVGHYSLVDFHSQEEISILQSGAPLIIHNTKESCAPDAAKRFEDLNIQSLLTVPYVDRGRWKFAISAQHAEPHLWQTDEIESLLEVAQRLYLRLDRARADAELRESEERYRTVFNSIDEGFAVLKVIFGPDGEGEDYLFLEVNPAFEKHTGLSNAVGKRIKELVPQLDNRWPEICGRVVRTGIPVRVQDTADAMNRYFDVYATRVGEEKDHKVAVVFSDITEARRAQKALDDANSLLADKAAHLEALVEQRTLILQEKIGELEAFSYSISHDMRAPLRAMHGYAQTLIEEHGDRQTEEGRGYLERIQKAATRLDLLIRDVLAYSKVAKEKATLYPVDLGLLVREVIGSFSFGATSIQIADPLPSVMGHEALLSQIFSNLVSNAIKFAQKEVELIVRVRAETSRGWAKIWVEDTGIGIAPVHYNRIFEIFGRVQDEKKFEGTGIGLAIVKKAVERLGGKVGVESQLGVGSKFWFTLRLVERGA